MTDELAGVICAEIGNTSIKKYQDDYLQKYQDENVKTVLKRVFLYPYLVEVSRKELKEAARSNEKKIQ